MKYVLALLAALASLMAQTQIDLQHQSKRVDFTSAQYTKPFKTGNTLPATCAAGEVFLFLPGQPGTNIYTCISNNIWVMQGGSMLPESTGQNGKLLTVTGSDAFEWISLTGDVLGGASTTVTGIQGRPVTSSAPADGDVLVWNATDAQWKLGRAAGGSVAVHIDGVPRGTRSIHDYITGTGLLQTASDNGTAIQMQHAIDTAIVQTRANAQSGADVVIALSSNSGTTFIGSLTPALSAYSNGMTLQFRPNQNCSGSPTLNLDTLGARAMLQTSGSTPMVCTNGTQIAIWYDASADSGAGAWRSAGGSSSSATAPPAGMVKSNGTTLQTASVSVDYVGPTSGTAIQKANGGGLAPAVPGVDYVGPTSGTAIQKANGGGLTPAVPGVDYVGPTSGSEMQKASNGGLVAATVNVDYLGPTTGSAIQKASGGGLAPAVPGVDYPAITTVASVFTHPITTAATSVAITSSANGGTFQRIFVPGYITVSKVYAGIGVLGSASCNFAVGIYSTSLAKLGQTNATDCGTGVTTTGPKSLNLQSAVSLAPGEYYVVYASNDATLSMTGVGGNTSFANIVNQSPLPLLGRASSIYSAGTLTATLPTLTGSAVATAVVVLQN